MADVFSRSTLHEGREAAICLALGNSKIAEREQVLILRILLDHGAKADTETQFKGTPLHYAGKLGRHRVLQMLLSQGEMVKVNAQDGRGMTPLHRAVIGWNDHKGGSTASTACVRLLVEAKADVEIGDDQGHMPVHWAAGKGRSEIMHFLIDRFPGLVNQRCVIKGSTPLHWASGWGHNDMVVYLFEKGANPTITDRRGKMALHWAARYGRVPIVDNIIRKLREMTSLDLIDRREEWGRTALLWASLKGHSSCALKLIDNGADINIGESMTDDGGGTPLSYTLGNNSRDKYRIIASELLKRGAQIQHECHSKRSAVLWAARGGDIEIFDEVCKMTEAETRQLVDINECDEFKGSTAFMLAASWGHLDMLKHMRSRFPDLNVNIRDEEGNTALMIAAGWGRLEVVRWLCQTFLGSGLDIDLQNKEGQTALHRAAHWDKDSVISELLYHGAEESIQDAKGRDYHALQQQREDMKNAYQPKSNIGRRIHLPRLLHGPIL
ncbi:uncharacterized protein DNG_00937 [Cephalotrichum gorgonifer]|uniref:Uncharacterized protein n=1 Tax=Cephalotrichum gorgonifer TaxID=2041049 RepID=A0AAE8SRR6_9PEZI|nr:uncharacterized protein DNG_00937 [Cephalotrichum gorgonifer]